MKTQRLIALLVTQVEAQQLQTKDQAEQAILEDLKREIEHAERQLEAIT